jgi:hypothetical protein
VASNADPRRLALLVVLVVALVVVVIVRVRPALQAGVGEDVQKMPPVSTYSVPVLGWTADAPRDTDRGPAARNLFTYGPPPTPTPDRRPTPTPRPTLPPPPPPPTRTPGPPPTPPAPRFTLAYLGWLGPDRLPIAVFRDGDEVLAVPRGDLLKGVFLLREVGPASVTVGVVGYPASVTQNVPLSR